jgi:hypothetical protein
MAIIAGPLTGALMGLLTNLEAKSRTQITIMHATLKVDLLLIFFKRK